MIKSIGQVMLYVENIETGKRFWLEKVGFKLIGTVKNDMYTSYTIAPEYDSEVQFVLYEKGFVAKASPEVSLSTPSILMVTENIQETYDRFIRNGINANPIMEVSGDKIFNFPDDEGNYFAVREPKR